MEVKRLERRARDAARLLRRQGVQQAPVGLLAGPRPPQLETLPETRAKYGDGKQPERPNGSNPHSPLRTVMNHGEVK